jgi:hypothetical protein
MHGSKQSQILGNSFPQTDPLTEPDLRVGMSGLSKLTPIKCNTLVLFTCNLSILACTNSPINKGLASPM